MDNISNWQLALDYFINNLILSKINFQEDMFVVAMGSKNINKFNPNQQVDLIEYLIKVIEIKINQL